MKFLIPSSRYCNGWADEMVGIFWGNIFRQPEKGFRLPMGLEWRCRLGLP
ncbi:hypothetical protein [Wielerella bovis]|nr:hypothetical protein [Wielerella bovis]ULJ60022.1 hypothetical protein MIS44_10230 [Wielerella bovis]